MGRWALARGTALTTLSRLSFRLQGAANSESRALLLVPPTSSARPQCNRPVPLPQVAQSASLVALRVVAEPTLVCVGRA